MNMEYVNLVSLNSC